MKTRSLQFQSSGSVTYEVKFIKDYSLFIKDYSLNTIMNKTNIFAYIELSKLISNLTINELHSKQFLKQQAAYFNIITGKFFSDNLSSEWEYIVSELKQNGPAFDEEGQLKANAFINTIDQMSQQNCIDMIFRISSLYEKVKLELQFLK